MEVNVEVMVSWVMILLAYTACMIISSSEEHDVSIFRMENVNKIQP
jgi:hypothetical protein